MGETLAGRYELVDPLGEGGAGVVWRAWDHRTRRYVAAKVMRQSDAGSLLRFVREQSVRIEHPHVLTPLGWAGEDDRVLLTMPIVSGGSAATLVGDHGALPPVWVATLLDQLLAALEVIHAAGLVHRDVKPANLLLDATGGGLPRVRLADFGVAAAVDQPRLTHVAHAVGTLGYAAPEALTAGWDPDPRADLYGAGLTAVELLTARRPSDATDVAAELVRAEVPVDLARLLLDLTAADPKDRPDSAAAARAALASTGLVARADDDLGAHGVEVFDQLPPLPRGWGSGGPEPAGPHRTAPDATGQVPDAPAAGSPEADPGTDATRTEIGPATREEPRSTRGAGGAPAAVDPPAAPPRRPARPMPRLGLALVTLGTLMVVVAAVLLTR